MRKNLPSKIIVGIILLSTFISIEVWLFKFVVIFNGILKPIPFIAMWGVAYFFTKIYKNYKKWYLKD